MSKLTDDIESKCRLADEACARMRDGEPEESPVAIKVMLQATRNVHDARTMAAKVKPDFARKGALAVCDDLDQDISFLLLSLG